MVEAADHLQVGTSGQQLVHRRLLAGEADAWTHARRLADDVEAVNEGASFVRPQQRRQDANGGRLAGAVAAEQAQHATPGDLEVDLAQRPVWPEAFAEALGTDGVIDRVHSNPPCRTAYRSRTMYDIGTLYRMSNRPSIWMRARRQAGRTRPELTLEAIGAAALAIADRDGLDALTMRRLAAELGVPTMTLYSHVSGKQDVLQLMQNAVAAEMLVPELPEDWRDALRAVSHHSRDMLLRHPWIASELGRANTFGPNTARHIDQSAQAVAGLDVDDDTKFLLLTAADDYTIGFALREIAIGGEPGRRFGELTSADFLQEMIEAGELPYLAQAGERGWKPPPRDFDAGLDVLLDGMNQLVERKRRELQTSKPGPVVDLRAEEDHDVTPERSRSRESGSRETSGN